ncbi:MAG: hypothetical protein H0U42_09305 [Thermoleophilaceae bacterium]|nr:hypothetical protein [Thermoleophilaceae bacterium]
MKYSLSRLCVGAVTVVALVVPATASAGGADAVAGHAKQARSALKDVARAAHAGNNGEARRQFRRSVRYTNKAMAAADGAGGGARNQAAALVPALRLEDYNVERYADLVDELRGKVQERVAAQLEEAMAIRQVILGSLTELMAALPAGVQEQVSRILANVFGDQEAELGDIEDAIEAPGVPADVEEQLGSVLDLAFGLVNDTLDQFESLLDIVPVDVRPIIQSALGIIQSTLGMIEDLVRGLLGGGSGGLGGLDGLLGGGGSGGGIPGLGGLFNQ